MIYNHSIINNSNDDSLIDLRELNLNKELNLTEILNKLQILMMENPNWYGENAIIKECLIGLRKITCRHLRRDLKEMVENKVHVLLFRILEYYQFYDQYQEKELEIIMEAIWAANNMICETNKEILLEIKKRNFLNVLRNYLYNINDKIVEQTAMCIGNIVVESSYFRDRAVQLGILDKIVSLSSDSKKPIEILKNCLFLISNILRGRPHLILEKIGPCLNIIAACLWKQDEEVVKICLWSISYISDGYEKIQNHIIQTGCIPKILEFVVIKKKEIQIPSLRILGNLAAGSNKLSEMLLDNNIIKVLIEILNCNLQNIENMQYVQSDEILNELLWVFTNLSFSQVKIINFMIDSKKLNSNLFSLLKYGSEKIRYQVLSIYYNFSKNGNKTSIDKLIEIGIIEIILYVFFDDFNNLNTNTYIVAIGLLNKIINIQLSNDRNYEIENKLNKIFLENSVKEKLENIYLNMTDDPIINQLLEKSIECLSNYFNLCNLMEY